MLARAARAGEAVGESFGEGAEQVYQYVFPVAIGRRSGYIEIAYPAAPVETQVREGQRRIIVTRAAILLAMGVAFWAIMRIHVGRPIRCLVAAMEAVGAGDLASRVDLRRRDEIGRLAAEFNRMAGRLQEARGDLLREEARKVDLERQMRRQQNLAALGKVSSELAHEIGTPLNIIAGRAEHLQARLDPGDPRARDLQTIAAQIERTTETVKRVLAFARSPEPQPRTLALAEVVRGVVEFLRREAAAREIRLEVDADDAPKLAADPDQLQQVLVNVFVNALEATPRGRRIRVEARGDPDDPGRARITVADTGTGIPPEVLPRVFEPFVTTKEGGRGTGLGLAISRDLVLAHGGEMTIASEPGRGTTVTIRLPREPPGAVPSPPPAEGSQPNLDEQPAG
jgi:signal transduction histidine kinase